MLVPIAVGYIHGCLTTKPDVLHCPTPTTSAMTTLSTVYRVCLAQSAPPNQPICCVASCRTVQTSPTDIGLARDGAPYTRRSSADPSANCTPQNLQKLFCIISARRKTPLLPSQFRLFVRHTSEPHQNGSIYRNTVCTMRCSNVSGFFAPNFVVVGLGVLPKKCAKQA